MALDITALTMLDTAKDELGLSDAAADARLERYIAIASEAVTTYLNRGPLTYAEGIVETVRGRGRDLLALSRSPIVAVSSVTYDGGALAVDADYTLAWPGSGLLYRSLGWYADGSAVVTYSAGWVTPRQAEAEGRTRTLPRDIEHACLMTVVALERARGNDPMVSSEAFADASVSYGGRNVAIGRGLGGIIPDQALTLLAPYRRPSL